MNSIINENIEEIRALCSSHNVKDLYVFGSVCSENFSSSSDVDFLISFNEMELDVYADIYFLLADKLENLLNRKVDLITDKSLSNPYFISSVNNTKQLVYD